MLIHTFLLFHMNNYQWNGSGLKSNSSCCVKVCCSVFVQHWNALANLLH